MLGFLIRQDLRQRFSGNVLGTAWAVLAPLLQLAVFALVFAQIFKARVPGLDERGYVMFLALGMWPWSAFAEGISRGMTALTDHAGLLNKVAVSAWDVVAARVFAAFIVQGIGFLVVVPVLWFWQGTLSLAHWPLTLLSWAGLLALSLAIAQIVAICHVFARDTQPIIAYLLTAWMFLTPILYDPRILPEWLGSAMGFNPMAGLIAGVRDPLLWKNAAAALPWTSLLVALTALGLSAWMARRFRGHVREFL
jgi:lipopolysaccharide transport system permease protein